MCLVKGRGVRSSSVIYFGRSFLSTGWAGLLPTGLTGLPFISFYHAKDFGPFET